MKSLILLAIVGVVGVSLIAGIVAYQFIRGQIQEQQDRQRASSKKRKK